MDQRVIDPELLARATGTIEPAREHLSPGREIHGGVFVLMTMAYTAILLAFWLAFSADLDTVFAIGVCAVYLAMYLGTPWALVRTGRRHAGKSGERVRSWGEFLEDGLTTFNGWCSGRTALIQILLVPVAAAIASSAIAFIIVLSRPG